VSISCLVFSDNAVSVKVAIVIDLWQTPCHAAHPSTQYVTWHSYLLHSLRAVRGLTSITEFNFPVSDFRSCRCWGAEEGAERL
jgi:hypothetical protein